MSDNQNTQAAGSNSKYYKRYNLQGVISGLVVSQTSAGEDFARFTIERDGKKPTKCKAFGPKAEQLLSQYNEGDTVRLFGFYKPESFTPAGESKAVNFQTYTVLWSGEPKVAEAASQEQQGETVEA